MKPVIFHYITEANNYCFENDFRWLIKGGNGGMKQLVGEVNIFLHNDH